MPTSLAFRKTLKWLANCSFILIPVNTLGSPSVLCECFLSISGELVLSFWTLKLSRSEHLLETANQMQRHFFLKNTKCSFLVDVAVFLNTIGRAVNVAWVIQLLESSDALNCWLFSRLILQANFFEIEKKKKIHACVTFWPLASLLILWNRVCDQVSKCWRNDLLFVKNLNDKNPWDSDVLCRTLQCCRARRVNSLVSGQSRGACSWCQMESWSSPALVGWKTAENTWFLF